MLCAFMCGAHFWSEPRMWLKSQSLRVFITSSEGAGIEPLRYRRQVFFIHSAISSCSCLCAAVSG